MIDSFTLTNYPSSLNTPLADRELVTMDDAVFQSVILNSKQLGNVSQACQVMG